MFTIIGMQIQQTHSKKYQNMKDTEPMAMGNGEQAKEELWEKL
jgi:hypothetical protein